MDGVIDVACGGDDKLGVYCLADCVHSKCGRRRDYRRRSVLATDRVDKTECAIAADHAVHILCSRLVSIACDGCVELLLHGDLQIAGRSHAHRILERLAAVGIDH
jgi:hypothetical protein